MARRKDVYLEAVRKIQTDTTVPSTAKTPQELEADIAELAQLLRGPLPNVERLEVYEAKRIRQRQLSAALAKDATP